MLKFTILVLVFTSLLIYTVIIEKAKTYSYGQIDINTPLLISKRTPVLNRTFENPKKIHNSKYPYSFTPLFIDRTAELDLSKYKCEMASFGYSVEEGKTVFPELIYPPCRLATGINQTLLNINRTENLLKMDCDKSEYGYYLSGPIPGFNLMKFEHANLSVIKNYTKPVSAEDLEYGLGFCSKHSIDFNKHRNKLNNTSIQHASMTPIFNKTLYFNSLNKVVGKPKIIFLLTLDSFSRRHVYRKLPNVVKFLNADNKCGEIFKR